MTEARQWATDASSGGQPALEIRVDLSRLVALAVSDQVGELVCTSVHDGVMAALQVLGVPGSVRARVTTSTVDRPDTQPLRVTVDGRRCRYDRDLARGLAEVQAGTWFDGGPWFDRVRDDARVLAAVLTDVAVAAVLENPATLLGDPQATAYRESIDRAGDGDRFDDLLREVLSLRLPIGDCARVAEVTAALAEESAVLVRERLVAALCTHVADVRLGPTEARAVTAGLLTTPETAGPFAAARDGFYASTGLVAPRLRLTIDGTESVMSLRVNALNTPPQRGPLAYPDTDGGVRGALTILVRQTLARYAHCLISMIQVRRMMDDLVQYFPALSMGDGEETLALLTAVLRNLVQDKVSVSDLRRICGSMLGLPDELGGRPLVGCQPGAVTGAVRRAMGRQLAASVRPHSRVVPCLLLSPRIEEILTSAGRAPAEAVEAVDDRILDAIAADLAEYFPGSLTAALITAPAARESVAALMRTETSRLRVMGLDELNPELLLVPYSRTTLPAVEEPASPPGRERHDPTGDEEAGE